MTYKNIMVSVAIPCALLMVHSECTVCMATILGEPGTDSFDFLLTRLSVPGSPRMHGYMNGSKI